MPYLSLLGKLYQNIWGQQLKNPGVNHAAEDLK